MMTYTRYAPWMLGIIAIWLIAAPFLLGYAESVPAMRNDVAVGIVMLIGAVSWAVSSTRGTDIHLERR